MTGPRAARHFGVGVIDRDEGSLEMSEGLQRMLEVVARASGWLLVTAAATCFEVLARKSGLPVP